MQKTIETEFGELILNVQDNYASLRQQKDYLFFKNKFITCNVRFVYNEETKKWSTNHKTKIQSDDFQTYYENNYINSQYGTKDLTRLQHKKFIDFCYELINENISELERLEGMSDSIEKEEQSLQLKIEDKKKEIEELEKQSDELFTKKINVRNQINELRQKNAVN